MGRWACFCRTLVSQRWRCLSTQLPDYTCRCFTMLSGSGTRTRRTGVRFQSHVSLSFPPSPLSSSVSLPRYTPPSSTSALSKPVFLSFFPIGFLTAPFAPVPLSSMRQAFADWFDGENNTHFVSAYLIGCQRSVAVSTLSRRLKRSDK